MVLILPAPAKRVGIYNAMLTEKPIAKTNKIGSSKSINFIFQKNFQGLTPKPSDTSLYLFSAFFFKNFPFYWKKVYYFLRHEFNN